MYTNGVRKSKGLIWMNNYQKYFGTLERAAATLADLETENQYLVDKTIREDMPREDLEDVSENVLARVIAWGIQDISHLFKSIEDASPFINKERSPILKPTGVHQLIDWLNKECKSND